MKATITFGVPGSVIFDMEMNGGPCREACMPLTATARQSGLGAR